MLMCLHNAKRDYTATYRAPPMTVKTLVRQMLAAMLDQLQDLAAILLTTQQPASKHRSPAGKRFAA